ncbi:hypothetical protein HDU98_009717 [Podochytrium sp. JEL0797]|nr:hypothetical protein HDU98_009717 [Podochytrium sp. JEL0797]
MSSLACCSGAEHALTTPLLGHEEVISSHACYVSHPKIKGPPISTVVIATDVFGFKLSNARLLADKFAAKGHLAVVPDLFKGSEPPADLMASVDVLSKPASIFKKIYAFARLMWYFPPFIWRNSFAKGTTILENVISELRVKRGIKHVAVQGYCWGGALTVKMAQKPNVLDAACAAHPGGLKFPADIEAIQKPIYFVLPSNDREIKLPQKKIIEEVLSKKDKDTAQGFFHQVEWFEGAEHGFAVRGSEHDPVIVAMRQVAFDNAASFFEQAFDLMKK